MIALLLFWIAFVIIGMTLDLIEEVMDLRKLLIFRYDIISNV